MGRREQRRWGGEEEQRTGEMEEVKERIDSRKKGTSIVIKWGSRPARAKFMGW